MLSYKYMILYMRSLIYGDLNIKMRSGLYSDINLTIMNEIIKTHKIVLNRIPFFRDLLSEFEDDIKDTISLSYEIFTDTKVLNLLFDMFYGF